MKILLLLIQLLFVLETTSLFFKKAKKDNHHLIAAKHDPEMPARVRQILEKVGDKSVLKIQLGRTPVEAVLVLFLNLFSSWKFADKQLELGYDQIYHNYLLITIQNDEGPNVVQQILELDKDSVSNSIYKLDKAHRIRLTKPTFPTEFVDLYDIPLTSDKTFTLNRLITTASNIDKHFFTYDAANNNMCQTFVENIIDINGLTSNIIHNATRIALKPQDGRALIATLGSRSDIVKHVTDLGGKIDRWVFDNKILWKKPLMKEFNLFENMHVKTSNDNTEDILQSSADSVVIKGMTDVMIVNTDEVFNAVVALEEEDKTGKPFKMIIIIISIVLFVVIVAVIIVFFIWRKRKGKLMKNGVTNDIIDKSKSDSNLSEITDVTGDK